MRIITGKYKGRILNSIPDLKVRPATDRVKTTIFNMLQNRLRLSGASVLDLYAGSGSLGFEALSRGASHVTFVDDQSDVMDAIESNAEDLDCLKECVILQDDAVNFIGRSKDRFDLIFADPPYSYERTAGIPGMVLQKGMLKEDGYLIIEHSKHTKFEPSPLYHMEVQKEFGNTRVSFFIHPKGAGGEK